jgi:hypothetical protein
MKITKSVILLALTLALVACDAGESGSPAETTVPTVAPTNTPEPTSTPATGVTCLNGTWELFDIENYMNSVIPPELAGGLAFIGSSGTATTNFGGDGLYAVTLEEFQVQYTMDVGSGPVPLEVYIDGDGSGVYEAIDDHTIHFTELDNSGMIMTVLMGGETIDLGMEDAISAFGGTDTTFEFDCSGDTLLTYPPIEGALPVEYVRVP